MAQEKAIILSSGGLNSAVMASVAGDEHDLAMLHVRFGHRAEEREADCFEKQAAHFEAKERMVVEMPHFAQIGGNARVNRKLSLVDATTASQGESNCQVAGLIGAVVQAAFTWACANGATKVFLGVCESGGPLAPRGGVIYPDHSRDFALLCQHLYAVAAPNRSITIETPLIDMKRADIVRLGQRLEAPFELTWSCLSSGTTPCGGCLGCATRNRAFLDAAIPDPILLQPAAAGV